MKHSNLLTNSQLSLSACKDSATYGFACVGATGRYVKIHAAILILVVGRGHKMHNEQYRRFVIITSTADVVRRDRERGRESNHNTDLCLMYCTDYFFLSTTASLVYVQ